MTNARPSKAGRSQRLLGLLAFAIATTLMAGCSQPAEPPRQQASKLPERTPLAQVRLVTPESLGGLPKSLNRTLVGIAKSAIDGLKREVVGEPTSAMGWAYGGRSRTDDTIIVSGVTGTVANPSEGMGRIVALLYKVRDFRSVEPGRLGGEARCGIGETNTGYQATVCAWASGNSIGTVAFLSRTNRDRSEEFVTIREQIHETR